MSSSNDQIIEKLNFTGDKNSWFDLWHLHIEMHLEQETDWTIRKESIKELLRLFRLTKQKLEYYPKDYQLWIEIYDEYVGDDAIFIHTQNPNSDNFPAKVQNEFPPQSEDSNLKMLLLETGLTVVGQRTMEGNFYLLFDENVGIPLS